MDEVVREIFKDYPDNVVHYGASSEVLVNMGDVFGSGNGDLGEIADNPNFWKSWPLLWFSYCQSLI